MQSLRKVLVYSDGRGATGCGRDEGTGVAFLEGIPRGKEGMELAAEGRGRREFGTLGSIKWSNI